MLFLVAAAGLLSGSGCQFMMKTFVRSLFGVKETDPHKARMDALWKEGYGFNNPNPQRLKEGKEPEPFYD